MELQSNNTLSQELPMLTLDVLVGKPVTISKTGSALLHEEKFCDTFILKLDEGDSIKVSGFNDDMEFVYWNLHQYSLLLLTKFGYLVVSTSDHLEDIQELVY